MRAHGVFRVGHGGSAAARLLARLLGLPRAGRAIATRLVVMPVEGGERWTRTFDGRPFASRQYPGPDGLLCERFGIVELRFRRDVSDACTRFHQSGAAIVAAGMRIALPRACAPRVTACERAAGPNRRHVDVRLDLPIIGPILTYDGTIDVEEDSEAGGRGRAGESAGRGSPEAT